MLERTYKGRRWRVTVLEDGFVFDGTHYASLTTIATMISGSRWNGFTFFGLGKAASTDTSS